MNSKPTPRESPTAWEVSDDIITDRVIEYLGGDSVETATCNFIAACDSKDPRTIRKRPVTELSALLSRHSSLARSLDDAASALIHLDLEYVNFDDPAAAFTDPSHAFAFQQPVVEAIEELLAARGIRPLHLITGQGHHFVWSVPRGTECEARLADLALPDPSPGEPPTHGAVFDGTALLMEFFANEVRTLAAPRTKIPVELTAVHVGPGATKRREMISVDVSEYGDPLETRMIRIPFTAYRKPWACGLVSALGLDDQIGHFVTLPLHEMDVTQCLAARRDVQEIISIARRASVRIPDNEMGTSKLIDSYLESKLRSIHEDFYRDDPISCKALEDIYGEAISSDSPGCVRRALEYPNEILLKPAIIQLVTRHFLARGWKARHIAGLVCSRFSNPDHNWGTAWNDYSSSRRADFYVRLFSGLIAQGRDPLIDFNCTSQQEKGFCWPVPGSCSLEPDYQKLTLK